MRFLRCLVAVAVGRVATAVIRAVAPPDARSVPPAVADVGLSAEDWVGSLVWRHGPDERCEANDCYPCWVQWTDAGDYL